MKKGCKTAKGYEMGGVVPVAKKPTAPVGAKSAASKDEAAFIKGVRSKWKKG